MKPITYSKDAIKTLRRMPRPTADRIREKIALYASDPAALANNVTEMKGYDDVIRLRVGDWRVLMRETTVIGVILIAPRGGVYD
jgi:mRNA interferase RelE/StbE